MKCLVKHPLQSPPIKLRSFCSCGVQHVQNIHICPIWHIFDTLWALTERPDILRTLFCISIRLQNFYDINWLQLRHCFCHRSFGFDLLNELLILYIWLCKSVSFEYSLINLYKQQLVYTFKSKSILNSCIDSLHNRKYTFRNTWICKRFTYSNNKSY